jgi:hypothetical protein
MTARAGDHGKNAFAKLEAVGWFQILVVGMAIRNCATLGSVDSMVVQAQATIYNPELLES